MAAVSSTSKDEEELQDLSERCLQQIKLWPKIMELLTEEKVPAAQLRESLETLTQILQHVSDSLPEHSTTALDIIQKILNVHITHIYRALNGSNESSVIVSALNLLVAMVTYGQHAARDVLVTVNFQQGVFMTLVNRTDSKSEDDVRTCCIRLAMAFFVSGDNKLIKQFLTRKDFLKSFFKKLGHDRASNIKLILVTLTQYLVCNPAVTKTEKLHILNNYTLQQLAALYTWKGTAEAKNDTTIDEEFQVLEIRQLCHQFLLKVTCDLKHGINFLDNSLGLSGKNCNSVLLKFLLSLHNTTEDELVLDLVVNILHTCPDLLNRYLSQCKLSFQPRPSASWLDNMKVLEQILTGQSVIPSALLHARNTSTGYMVQLAMASTIPTVMTPVLLSQAVKHSSLVVSCCILQIIRLILDRAHGMIDWLRESRQTAVISQYQQALIKALPDLDTYVNLLHKTLDRPLDGSQRAVTRQEPSEAESEMEHTSTAVVTEVPVAKKDELLTALFDVLSAYQLTIPLSFTPTTYDFSRLPHLIYHTESPLVTEAIEKRAIRLLLAFPEGKLRGFKEVRGEDGSTVLLLLRQLISASTKSDLCALKIKLLNKFIQETGLFAQTEWEIAIWLDILATFSEDETKQIVDVFYKSLTQAIRNPYPFNDRVMEAMHSACAVQQHGQEGNVNDTLSPDILAMITHTASHDLDDLAHQPISEAHQAEPLPCSALLPSALQVFAQLEGNTQGLFGHYVSLVALSILERQDNPMSVCLLLHHCTQTEGSGLQHNLYWQDVMKYYAMWLPAIYKKSALYQKTEGASADQTSLKPRNERSSALRSSIMQGGVLKASDMERLLRCDQRELLPMIRQLLMYIYTLHIIKPKNMLAVLKSYLLMIESALDHVHAKRDKETENNIHDPEKVINDGMSSVVDPSRCETSDEWWTSMAELVLQHAAFTMLFKHSARNVQKEPVTSGLKGKPQTLSAITSCFLKCLSVFKQHLSNDTLKLILRLIIKESCQNYLNLAKLEMNSNKDRTKGHSHESRSVIELFQEMCVYCRDEELVDAIRILLQSLKSQKISAVTSGTKQHLRSTLCHLLEVHAEKQKAMKLKQSVDKAVTSKPVMLSTDDISTLVELAHQFSCDQMASVLSQFVGDNPELVAVFTKEVYMDWLNQPTKATSQLVCQLMKHHSAVHIQWFEEWCLESSKQELNDKEDVLLPVILAYCKHSSASKQILSILHATYWIWLKEWIAGLQANEDVHEEDDSKMELLSQILMDTQRETLILFLQSLIRRGQGGKHLGVFHRLQLKACQLAVERLANRHEVNKSDQKTGDVLVEVVVACLQNVVTLIKKNPDNTATAISDQLMSTTAVVKAVGTRHLSVSPSLTQAWKSLVRNGLKHCYQSPAMLELIASLVKLIYSSNKDSNLEKEILKNLLPLSVLYQIVLSHSLFLPTVLEEQDENRSAKESLVLLMLAMVELEPRCCHEAHYAVLIGAYNITRSNTDTALLMLMQHYQRNQAVPSDYKPTAWGRVAVSQHQTLKALGKSLWQQPTMKEILQQLDTEVLRDSALHFPLHRKLQGESPCDPSAADSSHLYDPGFLYPLYSNLLAPECVVDCCRFIDSNAFYMVVAGLSSYDRDMRRAAYHVMASFLSHLEHARFRGRREVYYLLHCFRNSITEPSMRVPSIVGAFVARSAHLMLTPEHFMYPTVLQYLLIKPHLQMNAVPLFGRLFYSSSFKHEDERYWILTLLLDGLRDSNDVTLYNRSSVFTTLMACYQSRLASKQFKEAVVRLLDRAFDVPETRDSLSKQLLPSLQAVMPSQDSRSQPDQSERKSTLADLMHKLHSLYRVKSHNSSQITTSICSIFSTLDVCINE
ncbi:nucleolar pre-ribosomal-associated protein 1-like [Patiria miniata]|uniref:Nucleolar pre-ribosomal-associated protein 1 n=1 Tax=Patiria miniata TaxID=46514 RepID=A0A914B7H1_PATMI|nr:nucleolar pre-ribosomal-associated protein 1-like [Patiria miniata]XP_038072131.1 nucleolar pre-ribosomal-associated protein 1-like [Patiria miniata]